MENLAIALMTAAIIVGIVFVWVLFQTWRQLRRNHSKDEPK
jgi:heme/copper-type cytochrome/quinol oxidase subunit 2